MRWMRKRVWLRGVPGFFAVVGSARVAILPAEGVGRWGVRGASDPGAAQHLHRRRRQRGPLRRPLGRVSRLVAAASEGWLVCPAGSMGRPVAWPTPVSSSEGSEKVGSEGWTCC